MSERKAGWYWVKPPFGQWVAANWNPEYGEAFSYWEMPGTEEGFGDDQLLEIGPRIPTPDENWQCVPKEPTGEMQVAGEHAKQNGCYPEGIYRDMLSAAPKPEDV